MGGGGGSGQGVVRLGRGGGVGSQVGCEWRSEAFVKIKKIYIFFFGGGGGGVGHIFFFFWGGGRVRGVGGVGLGGGSGWMGMEK